MPDLIHKDEERSEKVAAMQRFVDEGLESGTGRKTKDELFQIARARIDAVNRG